MNNKSLLAIGVALALVILALGTVIYLLKPVGGVIDSPRKAMDGVINAMRAWGQNKIEIKVQNETIECKPIGELALRRVRIRSICVHESTAMLSTKRLIAHRSFDVKLGWDLHADLKIKVDQARKTVTIDAPEPKVLSVTGVEPQATIIHREDGLVNWLSPEDMSLVMKTLEQNARSGAEVTDAREDAKDDLRRYFSGMFAYENYTTTINFPRPRNSPATNSVFPPPAR